MRADLHMHGPIGFQKYWLKKQGYQRENILELIANRCFDIGLDICAITSDEDKIPRKSIHDRFNWLKDNCAKTLGYEFDTLGKNIAIIVKKDGKKLYLINGQTVRAKVGDRAVEHLVVGTNEVPIGKELEETLKWIQGETNAISTIKYPETRKIMSITEHSLCIKHGGIGKELLEKHKDKYHLIEGHNSQLIFEGLISKLPPFKDYCRQLNYDAQYLAEELKKHWIATSDAHTIESAGLSYIYFIGSLLDTRDEEKFMRSFIELTTTNQFDKHCAYEPFNSWKNWVSKYIVGTRLKKDK